MYTHATLQTLLIYFYIRITPTVQRLRRESRNTTKDNQIFKITVYLPIKPVQFQKKMN